MAKRMTKAEANGYLLLVIVGLPLYMLYQLIEVVGWTGFIAACVLLVSCAFWYNGEKAKARALKAQREEEHRQRKKELELEQQRQQKIALTVKYGDPSVADKIIKRIIWQGETADQLRESLGEPLDIDEKVLKTKTKQIWKYYSQGANRFGLRVTLENTLVVGWDEKL